MYIFSIDGVELPVTPAKMQTKINNNNKTVNLINGGEVSILKEAGLTDISFEALIPQTSYPFANNNDHNAKYYLDLFEKLKTSKQPFQFVVIRQNPNNDELFGTDITVSLEDYTITEDAKNGLDLMVSIKLKQYRSYQTKILEVQNNTATVTNTRDANTAPNSSTHTVIKGDTLWGIAKKYYNDGSKYGVIYDANKTLIDTANSGKGVSKHTIYVGQVLTIP